MKEAPGSVNVAVVLDGVEIRPGDVIVADDDGVVVVPAGMVEATLEASRRRLASETDKRRRFAAGELGVDMYGLRQVLTDLGVSGAQSGSSR